MVATLSLHISQSGGLLITLQYILLLNHPLSSNQIRNEQYSKAIHDYFQIVYNHV
jgi:hypothetical protein